MIGAIFVLAKFNEVRAERRFEAADSPELKAAAVSFAKRGDSLLCEDEAISRIKNCRASVKGAGDGQFFGRLDEKREALNNCSMEVLHFHRHCLEAAPKSAGFCIRHKGHGMTEQRLFTTRCAGDGLMPSFDCMIVVAESVNHCAPAQ